MDKPRVEEPAKRSRKADAAQEEAADRANREGPLGAPRAAGLFRRSQEVSVPKTIQEKAEELPDSASTPGQGPR